MIWQKIDAGGPVFTQGYAYDRLNRLKTMYETGSCGRTYVYDRYGNRAVQVSPLACITLPAWTPQVASDSESLVAG